MPWKTRQDILEAGKKFIDSQILEGKDPFEMLDFWFNAICKLVHFGDISIIHGIREELEQYILKRR